MLFPKFELPSVTGHHLISPLRGISSPHTHTWNFPSVTIPTYCCFSLFIWLCQVFVAARGTSSCGMWTLSCGTWDLVPWPGMKLGPLHCEWSLSHWTMREVTYEGVFSYWISYRSSLVPSSFFFPPNKKCSGLRRALSVRFRSSWLQQKLVFEKQEWRQLHHQLCSHEIHMATSLNALLVSWGFSGHLAESWAS